MLETFAAVFDAFPELETARLRLRQSRPDDAEAVYAILSQERVTRWYNLSPLTSRDEARAVIDRRIAAFARRERIRWAVARREEDSVIGSCGFVHWNQEASRAEIGYELAPEWQGQGLMREAMSAMLTFGFGLMGLNRAEAFVVPENEPSLRLLRRLGFREEGMLREYGFWKGRFHDQLLLSLLKKDWHE